MTSLRRIGLAALLVLAVAACTSDDGDDATPRPSTTTTTDATVPTTERVDDATIGGSRYLAYVRQTDEGGDEVVRRDLRTGEERTARAHDPGGQTFADVAVSPTGALAWDLTSSDGRNLGIQIVQAIEDTPVDVQGIDVYCPQWREDGVVSHTYTQDGRTRAAVADGETGAYLGSVRYDLPTESCAALIGADSIVFARPRGDETYDPAGAEIVRVSVGGGHEQVVGHIDGACWPMFLAGSPDGDRLAVTVYCDREEEGPDRWGVYVGSLDDDLRPLVAENDPGDDPDTAFQYSSPSWSADGSVLVYTRSGLPDGSREPQIFSIEVDGGDPVELVPGPAYGGSLSAG